MAITLTLTTNAVAVVQEKYFTIPSEINVQLGSLHTEKIIIIATSVSADDKSTKLCGFVSTHRQHVLSGRVMPLSDSNIEVNNPYTFQSPHSDITLECDEAHNIHVVIHSTFTIVWRTKLKYPKK